MDNEVKLCPFRKTVLYEDWDRSSEFSGDVYGYAYLPRTSSETFLPCLGEACAAYNNHYLSQSKCLLIGDKK